MHWLRQCRSNQHPDVPPQWSKIRQEYNANFSGRYLPGEHKPCHDRTVGGITAFVERQDPKGKDGRKGQSRKRKSETSKAAGDEEDEE